MWLKINQFTIVNPSIYSKLESNIKNPIGILEVLEINVRQSPILGTTEVCEIKVRGSENKTRTRRVLGTYNNNNNILALPVEAIMNAQLWSTLNKGTELKFKKRDGRNIEDIANTASILAFNNKEPTPNLGLDNDNNISFFDIEYIEYNNLLIAADLSHYKWGYCTTIIQVPLNNIKDFDTSSVQSKNNNGDIAQLDEALDEVVKVPLRKKLIYASDFLMALYLWCKKENIK
ncbi:hypothetical protein MMC22_000079 [Lobaria immixta]|nr:hypothetical protein [Lobaria immixta]